MLNENEHLLLHVLLHHGGITNGTLAADLLKVSERRARDILLDLLERGYVRRIYIEVFRDTKNYYQVTRKAARFLGHPGANSTRGNMDFGWVMRGLLRFWFRARYPVLDEAHFLHGGYEIEATFAALGLRSPGAGKERDRFAETVMSREDGTLEVWSFPAIGRPLKPHVEGVVLRYADAIPWAKIGWVIEHRRSDELRRIIGDIAGREIPARTLAMPQSEPRVSTFGTLAVLQARQRAARTVAEKIDIQHEIDTISAPAPSETTLADDDVLSATFLPVIVHEIY